MSDLGDSRKSLAQQVKRHLEALKASGIEFVRQEKIEPLVRSSPAPSISQSTVPTDLPQKSSPAPLERVSESGSVSPDRLRALSVLAAEVAKCDRCKELFSTRTQTVFGVGRVSPDVCFVGEAPGADEDRQGEPFVGAAGQLLNKIIAAMGMKREEVYICNTIKCRPPQNRVPSPQECLNCREFFEKQIELIQPRFICCLGSVAAQNVLGTSVGITKLRGRFYAFQGIPVICTFHPAALLRNPDWKKETWEDMKTLLKEMGRPIPEPGKNK